MLSQLLSDQPYTTAEEDPFSVQPYIHPTKFQHKRSSMLDKWINEQQGQPSEDYLSSASLPPASAYFESSSVCGSRSNPYLAYPDLPRMSSERARPKEQDNESIISYDLIDDDDIPNDPTPLPQEAPKEPAVTPSAPKRTHKSSRNSIAPSFLNLTLSFRSQATQGELAPHTNMDTPSRVFTRLSLFPRTPRSSTGPPAVSSSLTSTPHQTHTKSASLPTLDFSATPQSNRFSPSSSTSRWRPSVLGHFQQSSMSEVSVDVSEPQYAPSRPSISSADTYSTWDTSRTGTTTTFDSNIPSTPSKVSLLESIRLRGNKSPATRLKGFSRSTLSLRSSAQQSSEVLDSQQKPGQGILPQRTVFASKPGSQLDNIDDEDDLDDPPTYKFNQHPRNAIPRSASGTFSRVKFSSLNARAHRKKKKLLVTGVGVAETRKFEGVKRWCESFGEIRQITRLPNGDLQIDFRDPEVADTVCRVRAKVYIAGVGSVQLSWVAGNKR